MEVTLAVILVPIGTVFSLRRSFNILLLFTMMGLPQLTSAGTVNVLTPVNVTISTTNFNDAWIICGVPIASCNANSPLPLINVSIQADSWTAFLRFPQRM